MLFLSKAVTIDFSWSSLWHNKSNLCYAMDIYKLKWKDQIKEWNQSVEYLAISCAFQGISSSSIEILEQDRRWNADKPSATLDP